MQAARPARSGRPGSRVWRSAMRRNVFSTMMTAPSIMSSKSSAPRLIRFAGTPNAFIPVAAITKDSGMTSVAMRAARGLPRKTNSVAITSNAPIARFSPTVVTVALTSCERSRSSSRRYRAAGCSEPPEIFPDRVATVRLFSPVSINAVPITTSRPFLLAAPVRN